MPSREKCMRARVPGLKKVVRRCVPESLWTALSTIKKRRAIPSSDGAPQHLDLYWDPDMAAIIDTWGEGNVWSEIQYLMEGRSGRILDIACGTGKAMELLSKNQKLELFG